MEGPREKLIAIIEEARLEARGTVGSMNGGFAPEEYRNAES